MAVPQTLRPLAPHPSRNLPLERLGLGTAAALGLDYYRLKKRAEVAAGDPRVSGPAFVELPATVTAAKRCRLELDNGSGATMRVQLVGYDAADIEALSRGFWGAL